MRIVFAVLLMLVPGIVVAESRPPAPPATALARAGQPGWTVDKNHGCWIWNPEPADDDVMTWTGECAPYGPAIGRGTLEWRYGGDQLDRYEGALLGGQMDGRGKYTWANGKVYDGHWVNGEENGHGIYLWPDGSRYEGEWRDGKRAGHGTLAYANGNRYDGQWRNSKINGDGTMVYANGDRYEGQWADGDYDGQGTFVWTNGDRYDGAWKQGKSNGQGTEVFHTGDRYQGNWKDNQPDGLGQYWRKGAHFVGWSIAGCFKSGGPEMKTGDQIFAVGRPFDDCMKAFGYAKIPDQPSSN